jgi:peptidyl-prolyl cis-trans isomerase C
MRANEWRRGRAWMWAIGLAATVLAASSGIAATPPAAAQPTVVVNGAAIPAEELAAEVARLRHGRYPGAGALSGTQQADLERATIDAVVARELLYQEALRRGYRASRWEVDAQIAYDRQARRAGGVAPPVSVGPGVSDAQLRYRMEKNIVIRKFTDQEFLTQITETDVPDVEMRAWYDAHPEPFRSPKKARVREILVATNAGRDAAGKADARRRIEGLAERARNGEEFEELARRFSDGVTRARGGDLGDVAQGQLAPPLDEAIFSTPAGGLTRIVEDRSGFHLFQVASFAAAYMRPYADVRDRIYDLLRRKKEQALIDRFVAERKENASIVVGPATPPGNPGK